MTKKKFNILLGLIILSNLSIFFSVMKGSTSFTLHELLGALADDQYPIIHQIIFELRIPRTLAAFITGGLLAMSGVLMQLLLRNPLADPYILGISGGAAIVALMCLLLGLTGYWLTGGAWVGSLCVMTLNLMLTQRNSAWQSDIILLTGMALTSGFAALISLILILSPGRELHNMLFWLLGDLSYAHMPYIESIILLISLLVGLGIAKQLNLLSRSNQEAEALGIDVASLHKKVYLLCSLLTATAVALAGCISFVGLIIPHMLRLLGGYDHRWLIPSSILLGGSLLTFADTLSRSLIAPQQLPVGILMVMIGIPLFLWLLIKRSFL